MTPQQLKNSILQMAMQGKLVEQRPEEGTGEELYQQIQKEKKKLIKEGKIKKQKPLPEITEDEIPFEIPESWKWVRLYDICSKNIKRGKSPKYAVTSSVLAFAQKCNTKAGTIDLTLAKFVSEDSLHKYPNDEYMQNLDIVINSTGEGTLGRVGIYRDIDNRKGMKVVPDSHVTIIRLLKDIFPLYVYWCLKYYQPYLEKLGTGSTKQTELAASTLMMVLFPLPPSIEQKRIVAKIEKLMPYLDRYEKAYDRLESYNAKFPDDLKKSILQEAIQGKLVPQDPNDEPASVLLEKIAKEKQKLIKEGKIKKQKPLPPITEDEIPFEIPDSWEWARWGEVAQSIQYGYNAPAKDSGVIKMVRISDIQNGQVAWNTTPYCDIPQEEIPTYLLKVNDILFARTGGTVGKSYLVTKLPEKAIYAGYLIRTRYSEMICPQYLMIFMNSNLYWKQLQNGVIATAQPNCNGKKLGRMILPIPPLAEQHRIVAKLEELLPYVDRCRITP